MIDQKLCEEALQRIARDAGMPGDGELIYVWMQKILLGFPTGEAADISGALRENLGRRKLAAEIMGVMAEVMPEAIGDRPIIFQLPKPVELQRGKPGAKRRVPELVPTEPAAE